MPKLEITPNPITENKSIYPKRAFEYVDQAVERIKEIETGEERKIELSAAGSCLFCLAKNNYSIYEYEKTSHLFSNCVDRRTYPFSFHWNGDRRHTRTYLGT